MDDSKQQAAKGIQVNLPGNLSVLYSDSTFLTISPYGVVLDFAQQMGQTPTQSVVARIGMSKEHAKVLVEKLSGLLVKDEMKMTQVTKGGGEKKSVN